MVCNLISEERKGKFRLVPIGVFARPPIDTNGNKAFNRGHYVLPAMPKGCACTSLGLLMPKILATFFCLQRQRAVHARLSEKFQHFHKKSPIPYIALYSVPPNSTNFMGVLTPRMLNVHPTIKKIQFTCLQSHLLTSPPTLQIHKPRTIFQNSPHLSAKHSHFFSGILIFL